jgi:hypothetical protein
MEQMETERNHTEWNGTIKKRKRIVPHEIIFVLFFVKK